MESQLNRQTKKDMIARIKRINEKYRLDLETVRHDAERALWTLLANLGIKEASGRWWSHSSSYYGAYPNEKVVTYSQSDFSMLDKLHSQSKGKKY